MFDSTDGSSRNRGVAKRDGHAEPRGAEAYLQQYVEAMRGEPARRYAAQPHAGLSQRRIRDCSRSGHELCGLGRDGVVRSIVTTSRRCSSGWTRGISMPTSDKPCPATSSTRATQLYPGPEEIMQPD